MDLFNEKMSLAGKILTCYHSGFIKCSHLKSYNYYSTFYANILLFQNDVSIFFITEAGLTHTPI